MFIPKFDRCMLNNNKKAKEKAKHGIIIVSIIMGTDIYPCAYAHTLMVTAEKSKIK